MTRNDFIVGQTVYLKTISRLQCPWKHEKIIEASVSKIGHKHITVTQDRLIEYRFNMYNSFKQETDYSPDFVLFLSKEEIADYWQATYLRVEINRFLSKNISKLGIRTLENLALELGIPCTIQESKEVKK